MHFDSHYIIGKSHLTCQDYALHNHKRKFFGISDGCSSSLNTDFGSRILLKNAENKVGLLQENIDKLFLIEDPLFIIDNLNMPDTCLDATLNIGYDYKFNDIFGMNVELYGDGFIVILKNNGNFIIHEIDYEKNTPFYLSYLNDETRQQEFNKINQAKKLKTIEYTKDLQLVFEEQIDLPILSPFTCFEAYDGNTVSISLFSDGLKTLIPIDPCGSKLELSQVVSELINFPLINGDFVKRRVLRFLKNHKEHNFYDDFSQATCIFKD